MKTIEYSKIKKDRYGIEEDGRIYSYYTHKYMKTTFDKDGYRTLRLQNRNGGYSNFGVHRLLMITYRPIDNMENMTVNHIDGNKLNNSLDNLEWVTINENTRLAHQIGLHDEYKGEKSSFAVLTNEEASTVLSLIRQGYKRSQIKKIVPKATNAIISQIKNGYAWKWLSHN